jgi:hypothetical protein
MKKKKKPSASSKPVAVPKVKPKKKIVLDEDDVQAEGFEEEVEDAGEEVEEVGVDYKEAQNDDDF